ncbi:MAG: glycosyltransferase [Oscillochloris sp.]|nr:glycosyltransferase [Oscillochloris sp.]
MADQSSRIKTLDIELGQPLTTLDSLSAYTAIRALVRLKGIPLGSIELPVSDGEITATTLSQTIREQLRWPLLRQQLSRMLNPPGLQWASTEAYDVDTPDLWPSVTVTVCTRNRPTDLVRCIESLCALDYPGTLEILVIDNAPPNNQAEMLIRTQFPQARYIHEPRPGLDWARNRAIMEARGDIIAYTDDDVIVDRLWARAIARTFTENPGVMAITGLVEPLELETAAQIAFEQYGGFGRGYTQRWYGINRAGGEHAAAEHTATGKYGTGANMAYRREVFTRIGGFDPALDVGTVTNGGGDLEMFYRVIKAGFPLVYEPRAIVRHRHRSDYQSFLTQITNNGVGFYAYLERCFLHFPEEWLPIIRQGIWWFLYWYIYRMLLSFVRPINTTRPVILAELGGGLTSLGRYRYARHVAKTLAQPGDIDCTIVDPAQAHAGLRPHAVAVRVVDLAVPLQLLDNVSAYPTTRVLVQLDGTQIGVVTLENLYLPVSVARLRETILDQLGEQLLDVFGLIETIQNTPSIDIAAHASAGPNDVSVVLVARGNPDTLGDCLQSLRALDSTRIREIIVVDNSRSSSLIPQIVARFPDIRYLHEPRPGVAYALNRGILAATGSIIVTVDEQAVVPTTWLDHLLAPLAEQQVMAVIGEQYAAELETPAQRLVERLTHTMQHTGSILNRVWLLAAPTSSVSWMIGGAGNAAFRTTLFTDPQVGLFDEIFGSPQLSGAADAYLFYKLLRAGHKLAVEPKAYLWRFYPRDMPACLNLIEQASSARLALNLTLAFAEHDIYRLQYLFITAPRTLFDRLAKGFRDALRGRNQDTAMVIRLRGMLRTPGALIGRDRTPQPYGEHEQFQGTPGVMLSDTGMLHEVVAEAAQEVWEHAR